MSFARKATRRSVLGAAAASAALVLTGCVAGEGSGGSPAANAAVEGGTLNIDFATYNPLSLVIKEKGWLEASLKDQGVTVNWVQSAGSNKANEALRSGAIDVGSTAGSAALLARANGSPIKTIDIYSQPEWAALVAKDSSGITTVADLKGKSVAATKGTDPYFFLLQSLSEAGISAKDVTVQNLQHADGRAALENGSVDAWSGLDPIMAGAEQKGAKLFYRNLSFNTYGFLNATESFLKTSRRSRRRPSSTPTRRHAPGPRPTPTRPPRSSPTSPAWTWPSRRPWCSSAATWTWIRPRARPSARSWRRSAPSSWRPATSPASRQIDDAVASLLDDSLVKKADASAIKDS